MQSTSEFIKKLKPSEVMNTSELFHFAHDQHRRWLRERPLIEMFNSSEIGVTLKLLNDEIDELNGGDKVGLFSADNIEKDHVLREDYRQQEVSDIIIFLMSAFDQLGETIDLKKIHDNAKSLSSEYNFNLASADESNFPPQAMEDEKNTIYGLLKNDLNKHARIISQYDSNIGNREELIKALESILIYCVSMHSLMGVNSSKAVVEKVERNHEKYPAHRFQLSEEEMKMATKELADRYKEEREFCATRFDGPKEEINDPYDPEGKKIIERPKTGTKAWYKPEHNYIPGEKKAISSFFWNTLAKSVFTTGFERDANLKPEEKQEFYYSQEGWDYKKRWTGVFSRAAIEIMSKTYGFSVRVNDLLNKNKKK